MKTRGKVLDRVRKLLAVAAKGSGATEPERETAAKLAHNLMVAHGLTVEDLSEKPKAAPAADVFTVFVNGQAFRVNPDVFNFHFARRSPWDDNSTNGTTSW